MEYLIYLYLITGAFMSGMFAAEHVPTSKWQWAYKIPIGVLLFPWIYLGAFLWYNCGIQWTCHYFRFWYRARFTDYYAGGEQDWIDHVEKHWGADHRAWRFLKNKYNY